MGSPCIVELAGAGVHAPALRRLYSGEKGRCTWDRISSRRSTRSRNDSDSVASEIWSNVEMIVSARASRDELVDETEQRHGARSEDCGVESPSAPSGNMGFTEERDGEQQQWPSLKQRAIEQTSVACTSDACEKSQKPDSSSAASAAFIRLPVFACAQRGLPDEQVPMAGSALFHFRYFFCCSSPERCENFFICFCTFTDGNTFATFPLGSIMKVFLAGRLLALVFHHRSICG